MKSRNFKNSQKSRPYYKKNAKDTKEANKKNMEADKWDHTGFDLILDEENKKTLNFEKKKYKVYKSKYNNNIPEEPKENDSYFSKDNKMYYYEARPKEFQKDLNPFPAQKNVIPDRQLYKPGGGLKISKNKDKNNEDKASVSTAFSDKSKPIDDENFIKNEEYFQTIKETTNIDEDKESYEEDKENFLEFVLNLADNQKKVIKIDNEENFDKIIEKTGYEQGISNLVVVCIKIFIMKNMKEMKKFSDIEKIIDEKIDFYINQYRELKAKE